METSTFRLDLSAVAAQTERTWEQEILQPLQDYIAIPCLSPLFDKQWVENGYMEQAVTLIEDWCRARQIAGLTVDVVRLDGRTPMIFMEIPAFGCDGSDGDTVLLYGHMDKQPEMVGWREDLGPWKPVIEGDKLYGRGGADDGYAAFASLAAIEAVQQNGGQHKRCVLMIEACEESGSPDLPFYIDHLNDRIGAVSLVVCLDSGAGDFERLWSTTSLRGMIAGDLRVDIITEGVHSGDASGIVPSSFRILRQLLDRIESAENGKLLAETLHVEIPEQRKQQAQVVADVIGDDVRDAYPFIEGAEAMDTDLAELVLNRTWRPTLSVTGSGGMPPLADAGNVLRPFTALKLSFRLPPTAKHTVALKEIREILESNPPYGSKVSFHAEKGANGWDAPELATWLEKSVEVASKAFFNNDPAYMGEGGSIPFMGMLGEKFPEAQFLITGVLGPGSNAHGPNEFLHIPMVKGLTSSVSVVLDAHARRA
ncbi:MAG: M20/M25/M40 family metallo-hydrolase [Planctomycetes bacterium]|nr:M20/M25/M40 family metallo-hydrolase [Planctomycetota bacterium]MCP4770758.1 M20/M25/M40 family metallo-hydrolase [Planctomycetota bacterium]MCP4862171.1 M20/M25/M40 family metallo-hydrolase [Planctomycetota bacterium]